MVRLLKDLTPETRETVSNAVVETERTTSAEIIPVVIAKSDDHGFFHAVIGFFFSLVCVTIGWFVFQGVLVTQDGWNTTGNITFGLIPILLTAISGFVLGTSIARLLPIIVRPLIPSKRLDAASHHAAVSAFHRFKLTRTHARTGVLICVCLFERRVVVLGDEAISKQLSQQDWNEVRDVVLKGIQRGDLASGLIAGIKHAGNLLSQHFPADPDNPDEVTNVLRVLA